MFKTTFISAMLTCFSMLSQTNVNNNTASIHGVVNDKATKETVPFANVLLYRSDSLINKAVSDLNGEFWFKNLYAAKYKVIVQYVGYAPKEIKNILIGKGKTAYITIPLSNDEGVKLDELEVVTYQVPLIDPDTKSGQTITREDYQNMAAKNMNSVGGTTSGIFRGARCKSYINKKEDFNTESYNKINDNGFKDAKKEPLSTMSIDVDRASYSNVRRYITQGSLPPADAVRIEEMINYFSYTYPQPKGNDPFSITTEYTDCAWNKKHNLIHIGIQGKEVQTTSLPANNLVFLIDVSGSMMSEDKLPLLKSGLSLLVDQLRPQDKVSLVVYAGAAGVVLPPTAGNNKEKIMDAIEQLQAGGSTAGGEGIILAYKTAKENFLKDGNNRVILATDGDFNVGASSDGELITMIEKKREEGVFLTVLGFGTGNIKDSKMEQLADKGNGNYAYIDNILEAKKVLVKEMGGTLLTIAKDVKIQIEFNPAKVKGYRLVGYENRLLNNEDFNDDKKDAGELGSGHTVTAIYEIIPAGSDELVASVDALKYQQTTNATQSVSNEVMTIKFRYKEPKESTSKLITEIVTGEKTDLAAASENCKFSSAVAEFGMLLRDSEYKGDTNFKTVIALAKQAKGKDEEGYRAEFIRLVEMAELLKR